MRSKAGWENQLSRRYRGEKGLRGKKRVYDSTLPNERLVLHFLGWYLSCGWIVFQEMGTGAATETPAGQHCALELPTFPPLSIHWQDWLESGYPTPTFMLKSEIPM